ncbi:hypothetical protein ACFYZB_23335 [Streptomyces sp. NPDC001852]|uniref:hypothetical protein n=1 Tax=Streptomyces sp. NPDC001852 TaxID=3364619 RepID=UPI00367FCF55
MSVAYKAREIARGMTGIWWPTAGEGGLRHAARAQDLADGTRAMAKAPDAYAILDPAVAQLNLTGDGNSVFYTMRHRIRHTASDSTSADHKGTEKKR